MGLRRLDVIRIGAAASVAVLVAGIAPAHAQKSGGTLRIYNTSQPPSASIHEESTIATNMPFMAVFNNLVRFDPMKPRNGFDAIVPELAESWAWDATGTKLTFKLRSGVTWHDGKPFTGKDVQCTWHRLNGIDAEYLRRNPRKIWYENLKEVTLNGDHEVTFHLTKPQPSLLPMLASGLSPVYPCHVSDKDMRTKPVGTGPVQVRRVQEPRVHQAGAQSRLLEEGSALPRRHRVAHRHQPLDARACLRRRRIRHDLRRRHHRAADGGRHGPGARARSAAWCRPTCRSTSWSTETGRRSTRSSCAAPWPWRSTVSPTSTSYRAESASIAGNMMPPPEGQWGMPPEMLVKLPSYSPDVASQQAEARRIMQGLGYGPANRLKLKVSTRDFATYRDPAVIFVDQLNKVHFDAELEVIESSIWHNRLTKKDYTVALNTSGVGIDDPDAVLKGAYACNSEANYTQYCTPQVDKLLDEQSQQSDIEKRKAIVWEIERVLAEDVARPIVYHNRSGTCWHPHLKGYVHMENSIYNNWRFETVWLDK